MTDQGRIPESGLSPYVHALEAELDGMREEAKEAYTVYWKVEAELSESDSQLLALREELAEVRSAWQVQTADWADERARLREALNELGEYIRRGRGSDYAAMREILARNALKETT